MDEFDDWQRLSGGAVALRLGAFFVLFAAFVYLAPLFYGRPIGSYFNMAQARRDFVQREVVPNLVAQPLWSAVSQVEPETLRQLRDKIAGMEIETNIAAAQTAIASFTSDLVARRVREFGSASHADIDVYRIAESDLLGTMAIESVQACGNYALGGVDVQSLLTEATWDQYSDTMVAMLTAAKGGREAPVKRAPASEEDGMALRRAMAAEGMGPAEFAAFDSPDGLAAASPETRCAIATYVARGMDALPEPVADRLVIDSLQRGAGLIK